MSPDQTNRARHLPAKKLGLLAVLLLAATFCFWQGFKPASHQTTDVSPVHLSPVAYQPASTYEVVPQAIETVRVGQRVGGIEANPTGQRDERYGEAVIAQEWRKMVLRCPKRDGHYADVEMLRPIWWLDQQQVRRGGRVEINVPECGIEGLADVLDVQPCPKISSGPGRVVTATFHHQAVTTIDVAIEGLKEPIGTTPNHPFWSEEEQAFVRADQLKPGDHVRTLEGLAQVTNIAPRGPPEPVFNLEVHFEHVYRVGNLGVLVHNGGLPILNPCFEPKYGSYKNTHASGKVYYGKGTKPRSQTSGRGQARTHSDPHIATDWTPSPNSREAFKAEANRIRKGGGIRDPNNYNKINSPGEKYRD